MTSITVMKATTKVWLGQRPWLFEALCRVTGKLQAEITVLRRLVHPGDIVFDVGANVGQYACLFGHLVGPSGAVHAFEPVPPTFAELRRNVAHYAGRCRVFLNQCALGDAEGLTTMYVPRRDFTEAALVPHSHASWEPEGGGTPQVDSYRQCQVTTMDKYVALHGVGEIALVKCDVEGAELLVMRGATSILRSRPPILLLEIWPPWAADFGYHPSILLEFLEREAGYRFYHVGKEGLQLVSSLKRDLPGVFPSYLNYLCVVPRAHAERMDDIEDIVFRGR